MGWQPSHGTRQPTTVLTSNHPLQMFFPWILHWMYYAVLVGSLFCRHAFGHLVTYALHKAQCLGTLKKL